MHRHVLGMRVLLAIAVLLWLPVTTASATPPASITIETFRLQGSPGTFSISGAVSDAGTFTTLSVHVSAIHAPQFLVVHATYLFVGDLGSFTLRLQLVERLTANPSILVGSGTWVLLEGTGAYAGARAQGEIHGTADHTTEPLQLDRTYTGSFHAD